MTPMESGSLYCYVLPRWVMDQSGKQIVTAIPNNPAQELEACLSRKQVLFMTAKNPE